MCCCCLQLYSVTLIFNLRMICASLLFNVFMKTEKKKKHSISIFISLSPAHQIAPRRCSQCTQSPHGSQMPQTAEKQLQPKVAPCIGQTEASEHIQTGAGQICCMFDLEEDVCCMSLFLLSSCRRRFFFSVFFVDASITSSSDCFKNTPVSLFSTVKSPPGSDSGVIKQPRLPYITSRGRKTRGKTSKGLGAVFLHLGV